MTNRVFVILILSTLSFATHAQDVKKFTNGSVELFYEEFGKGPPIYILTGGPGESPGHPYYQIIDCLKSTYTCVLLHQRASGRSRGVPVNASTITIANYVSDIEMLRKTRNDGRVLLLGVSWGGLLAMSYAVAHPTSVSNLILVCSAPPSYTVWPVLYDNQFVRRSDAELDSMEMLQKIFSTKTERQLDSLKRADPSRPEVKAYKAFIRIHVRTMYYHRDRAGKHFDELFATFNFQPIPFIDNEVMERKMDITRDLRKLTIPALIVYGRQDDQGESTFFMQKEALRFSEMYVIEQCGHEIVDDQPEAFFRILRGYLKRNKN